jgi:hypothetical protein
MDEGSTEEVTGRICSSSAGDNAADAKSGL